MIRVNLRVYVSGDECGYISASEATVEIPDELTDFDFSAAVPRLVRLAMEKYKNARQPIDFSAVGSGQAEND
jgi:hypothetical protein